MRTQEAAPTEFDAAAHDRFAGFDDVAHRRVENRVNYKSVFRAHCLKLLELPGDRFRVAPAMQASLDQRVSAVSAVMGTASLRLHIQHAAVYQVKVGDCRRAVGSFQCGLRSEGLLRIGNNLPAVTVNQTGDGRIPAAVTQRRQKRDETGLPFALNAKVGAAEFEQFFGIN